MRAVSRKESLGCARIAASSDPPGTIRVSFLGTYVRIAGALHTPGARRETASFIALKPLRFVDGIISGFVSLTSLTLPPKASPVHRKRRSELEPAIPCPTHVRPQWDTLGYRYGREERSAYMQRANLLCLCICEHAFWLSEREGER